MATNNAANIGTAASGKVLQGAGAGNALSFSTPTYPSSSGTSRKILVSDGTNIVYSTETWATPGTSGNVLTSDGTNWTSAAPSGGGGLVTVTGTLTNAQIKSLHATPVQAIAAQGAGKIVQIMSCTGKMNYGGSNVFVAGASQLISLYYGTSSNIITLMPNNGITSSSTFIEINSVANAQAAVNTTFDNVVINLYNSNATEISGNAANNNTITWSITYQVIAI